MLRSLLDEHAQAAFASLETGTGWDILICNR